MVHPTEEIVPAQNNRGGRSTSAAPMLNYRRTEGLLAFNARDTNQAQRIKDMVEVNIIESGTVDNSTTQDRTTNMRAT